MMRFLTILFVALLAPVVTASAQNFMEHVRKTAPGQATVTVTQSAAIDQVVNGNGPAIATPEVKHTPKTSQQTPAAHGATTPTKPAEERRHPETSRSETATRENVRTPKTTTKEDNEEEIPVIDMRKKVMRGGYKVTGYRVQAFAGGNTRADRMAAERIRNAIKLKFPDQPVYVHFYSPRWICRVGNYRTYEEADWMLGQLRKMGYKAATIVKGKITVQY